MIIYKAINTENGKVYIGKTTKTLPERIKAHKYRYKKTDTVFYRAIRKYSFDKFRWEVIKTCKTTEELNLAEIEYIKENIDGYNIAKGGDGGDTISNHPRLDEIKRGVSEFHKGKKLTEEHKNKISEAHKGMEKPWSVENGKKMAESNIGKKSKLKGVKLSEEHKNNISKSLKGIKKEPFSEEHKKNLSKSHKGRSNPNKGKTLEEIMGVERAAELRKRQSESRVGRVVSEETKKKISETLKKRKNGK